MYNNVYVGPALDLLMTGLRPFVERQFQTCYGDNWRTRAVQTLRKDPESQTLASDGGPHLDVYALLTLMEFHWKEVFWNTLGRDERSRVNLLHGVRNRWAHQEPFSIDDTSDALNTIERLLAAIPAPGVSKEDIAVITRYANEVAQLKVLSLSEKYPPPENGSSSSRDGGDGSGDVPPPKPNPPASATEYIVQLSGDQRVVEVWSARLLPFEPKGSYLNLRKDIRDGIHKLPENPDGVLHAICGTPQQPNEKWDVENILFYNVGTSYFAPLARRGVRFERAFSYPSPPQPLGTQNAAYHRYTTASLDEEFVYWKSSQLLARWTNVEIPRLSASSKPASIWHRMVASPMEIVARPEAPPPRFGLTVMIAAPASMGTVNTVDVLKPLIDGLVSSFQAHDGEPDEVSRRIAAELGIDRQTVASLLCRRDRALLGARQLVVLRAQGVMWQPNDHLLLAAEVRVHTHPGTQWLVSGALFEIASRFLR